MSTTISKWGNSSGIRIPAKVLSQSCFKIGDSVEFAVHPNGNIELMAVNKQHRTVKAPGRTTAEKLYSRHPLPFEVPESEGWPDDDLVGAEWEAWAK